MPWYENRSGESLWYEDEGAGCPVVLVHGWCMSSAVWKYQLEGLSGSYRLLAPDLRGHGRSHGASGNLDFDSLADDLVDLFAYLNISRAVLVGWSMGAQVAINACAELLNNLAGLVLVSATPRFTASDDFPYGLADKESAGMRLKVQRSTSRALEGFYTRLFARGELENHPDAAEIRQLLSLISLPDTRGALEALDALARTDMRSLLPSITVPTLVINGTQDQICLPEASLYLKEHISGAEQLVFKGCGHASFLTQSDQFNAGLIRFIRSVCE